MNDVIQIILLIFISAMSFMAGYNTCMANFHEFMIDLLDGLDMNDPDLEGILKCTKMLQDFGKR